MARILIAEDSTTQAQEIALLLQKAGHTVEICPDGRQALHAVRRAPPDAVLTDLHMPEMNGLELVEAVREEFPQVPVVLMTAYGSEDTVVEALHRGAASYVPKRILHEDLLPTLEGVLALASAGSDQRRVAQCIEASEARFRLRNDPALAVPVVSHVQETMAMLQTGDETERLRLGVALEEAIRQAMVRGNLELSADDLSEAYSLEDGGRGYWELLESRRSQAPFDARTVEVEVSISRQGVDCLVRDEGPHADRRLAPERLEPADYVSADRRGLVLMHSFLDDVQFNDRGNEVRLVKRYPR
jgi:CheY-like chemotaxis protein